MTRPVRERADARTALVEHTLAVAIRTIVTRNLDLGNVGHLTGEHFALRTAVVALEDNERVVTKTFLVDRGNNVADLVVHARYHPGVSAASGLLYVLVTIDILLRRLVWGVWSVESEVEIERFVAILCVDVSDRVLADELSRVAFFPDRLVITEPVQHSVFLVREVVQLADHRTVLVIEAALLRPILLIGVTEMPFANDGRIVAGFLETLRHEPLGGIQPIAGSSRNNYRLQAVTKGIAAGHQCGTRGRAHRLHVKLLQPGASFGQLVKVRRLDVRSAVKTDVLPTKIIGYNVNYVRLVLRCLNWINRADQR